MRDPLMAPWANMIADDAGGTGAAETRATRHLCAGVYVDRSFRDFVIRRIHNDARRRVAPSYGFDVVPVVRHAWYAWLLDLTLHVAIVVCLIGCFALGGGFTLVLVVCATTTYALLGAALPVVSDVLRLQLTSVTEKWFERRMKIIGLETPRSLLAKRKRLLRALLTGAVLTAAAPLAAAPFVGVSLWFSALIAAAAIVVETACAVVIGVWRQVLINRVHSGRRLRPATLTRREAVMGQQQAHPCVVYQRVVPDKADEPIGLPITAESSSPFIGSGTIVNRWSPPLTVQLLRPGSEAMQDREYDKPPFAPHELVDTLRQALWQLGSDDERTALAGLQVCDRVYVAEPDVSSDRSLLADRPGMPPMQELVDDHRLTGQHFLEASVPSSGGELVVTVFLRVSLKGRCLTMDVVTCALARTPAAFQESGLFAEHGFGAVLRAALRAACTFPFDVLRTWRLLGAPIAVVGALRAAKDRTGAPRRRSSVGPAVVLREEYADRWNDVQLLDRNTIYDHMKIIDQRILKVTEDFLKDRKIDTSVFEKQATTIINSGVLNMGGTTQISQTAVGVGAQVVVTAGAESGE